MHEWRVALKARGLLDEIQIIKVGERPRVTRW
jgi:hypothetical protein